ncbi:hypothetical protein KQY30_25005 [Streptomyces sp. GMY02]|uniref:hypothetical protein n=1 Tax=Streptomyces sp. GMY02 TaxID=1333528 RepID=UPI001C2C511C|nr:hypothetical protein [Streptomyces sp. GMY02]QXE36985.1 hypothetical protein KQY30_25005 [Streptomyces sp. GMY02]
MSDFPLPDVDTVIKSARTYARDLTERVATSFLGGVVSGIVVTQPLDASMWYAALSGGVAAVVSLAKGLAARLKDVRNSASLARGV